MDKKIIIVVPYRGIGDIIFHLPLLRGIYDKFRSKVYIITNSSNKAKFILNNEISVKRIDYINFEREEQIKNSYLFLKKINSLKADICVLTAPTKRLIIPLLISNSKKKVFFRKSTTKDLSKYIFDQSKKLFNQIKFRKKYNLRIKKRKNKNKEVFISIDSHHDQNNWNEKNYINLIEKFLTIKKIKKIYINFAPQKINKFKKISKKFLRNKKILFTYKRRFSEIIKIINQCTFIIGNESGPTCLGASFNKKVFSIFDPKHTPNLSSKIINKKILYFNSKKIHSEKIIQNIIKKIR